VCLPGKLGQRDHSWTYDPEAWCDLQWGEWHGKDRKGCTNRYRAVGGIVFRDSSIGVSYDSCISVAAWITSAARLRLLQAMRICGWDSVYYVDTDAAICDSVGFERLQSCGMVKDREWGFLRTLAGPSTFTSYGIKSYSVGGRFINAGQARGQCVDAGDGKNYWYTPTLVESLQGSLRPSTKAILKRYRTKEEYRQGIVGADGKVLPIELREW
jgi:hypothetical protein